MERPPSLLLWLSRDSFSSEVDKYEIKTLSDFYNIELVEWLKENVQDFSGFKTREIERLVAHLRLESLPYGSTLFKAGDAADRVFIIRDGDVSLTRLEVQTEDETEP